MSDKQTLRPGSRRMPSNSNFYDKVIPVLLVAFGALTLVLILLAAGVLLGIVTWQ